MAAGFRNLSSEDSDAAAVADKCVQQVLYQLEHLSKVWRPVLPDNIYLKAMGENGSMVSFSARKPL